MSKPTKILVDGEEVVVEWDAKLGRIPQGYPTGADYKGNRIRMSKHVRRNAARENLMHELMHKLWEAGGLTEEYKSSTEEYIITTLAGRLTDLLRDNPELVEFLTEEG